MYSCTNFSTLKYKVRSGYRCTFGQKQSRDVLSHLFEINKWMNKTYWPFQNWNFIQESFLYLCEKLWNIWWKKLGLFRSVKVCNQNVRWKCLHGFSARSSTWSSSRSRSRLHGSHLLLFISKTISYRFHKVQNKIFALSTLAARPNRVKNDNTLK